MRAFRSGSGVEKGGLEPMRLDRELCLFVFEVGWRGMMVVGWGNGRRRPIVGHGVTVRSLTDDGQTGKIM
jgi:hypothetical protein